MNRDGLANFLLGLGVGVGVGMLFAPKSGEETRDLLMNKADEGKEYLRNKADESKEYLRRQTAEWRDTANSVVDRGVDLVNRQRDNLGDAIQAGKQAYRDKVEGTGTTEQPA